MPTATERLRVPTMNVLGPANPDWERRSHLLGEALASIDADVVALQEVPVGAGPAALQALLGPGYRVSGFSRAADDGVGGIIATR